MKALAKVEAVLLYYLKPIVDTRSIFYPVQVFLRALRRTTLALSGVEYGHS